MKKRTFLQALNWPVQDFKLFLTLRIFLSFPQDFDDFIFAFFAVEMVIKMVALGIFGKKSYLGDTWNRLDFFIVLAGWVLLQWLYSNFSLSENLSVCLSVLQLDRHGYCMNCHLVEIKELNDNSLKKNLHLCSPEEKKSKVNNDRIGIQLVPIITLFFWMMSHG